MMIDERLENNTFNDDLKNLIGTFAVEGMSVSDESIGRLQKMSYGEKSCSELVKEITQKYVGK